MSKPKTIVAIVLDKSGSMRKTKKQAIEGYNEEIQQLKENSKDQDILVCLVTFNSNVDEHLWLEPAEKLVEASEEDYVPNGGTAMYDAMGYTIQKLLDTTDYEDKNTSYLIRVISDGESMSDSKYGRDNVPSATLVEMIEACQDSKQWTISHMGCSASYLHKVAKATGISPSNMASWNNTHAEGATRGVKMAARKTGEFLQKRHLGVSQSMGYMNDSIGEVADWANQESIEWLGAVPAVASLNAGDVTSTEVKTEDVKKALKSMADVRNTTNIRYSVAESPKREGTIFAQGKRVDMTIK